MHAVYCFCIHAFSFLIKIVSVITIHDDHLYLTLFLFFGAVCSKAAFPVSLKPCNHHLSHGKSSLVDCEALDDRITFCFIGDAHHRKDLRTKGIDMQPLFLPAIECLHLLQGIPNLHRDII